jgi:hypothetical protein
MSVSFDVVCSDAPHEVASATSTNYSAQISGYCLWQYTGDEWVMKKDCCKEGFQPSAAPAAAGTFVGQLKSTLAEPSELVGA